MVRWAERYSIVLVLSSRSAGWEIYFRRSTPDATVRCKRYRS